MSTRRQKTRKGTRMGNHMLRQRNTTSCPLIRAIRRCKQKAQVTLTRFTGSLPCNRGNDTLSCHYFPFWHRHVTTGRVTRLCCSCGRGPTIRGARKGKVSPYIKEILPTSTRLYPQYLPVVPHKAVAEVSK